MIGQTMPEPMAFGALLPEAMMSFRGNFPGNHRGSMKSATPPADAQLSPPEPETTGGPVSYVVAILLILILIGGYATLTYVRAYGIHLPVTAVSALMARMG